MNEVATIADVARLAGVSAGTVSNVLNRPSYVSPATRGIVERAMKELGYSPTSSARQYRLGRERTIGMLVAAVDHPFFADVACGAEDTARAANCAFIMLNSGNSTEREKLNFEVAVQLKVQGLLVTPVEEQEQVLDSYIKQGIPVVFMDRIWSKRHRCSVAVDHVLGGSLAIEYLISLGHERMAFVGGQTSFHQIALRLEGAQKVANDQGIEVPHFPTVGLGTMDGIRRARDILAMPANVRPTAVLCANDVVALGFQQECLRAKVRVPEEISIVGYDDLEVASAAAIPLTTVSQPRREMGATAVRLLLSEIEKPGEHVHQQIVFEPSLVKRSSCEQPST